MPLIAEPNSDDFPFISQSLRQWCNISACVIHNEIICNKTWKYLEHTWRMSVSFETWIKYLQCMWSKGSSSFSFLRSFYTHEIAHWTIAYFESEWKFFWVSQFLCKFWDILPSFRLFHPLFQYGLDFLGTFRSYVEFFEPKLRRNWMIMMKKMEKWQPKDLSIVFLALNWMPGHFETFWNSPEALSTQFHYPQMQMPWPFILRALILFVIVSGEKKIEEITKKNARDVSVYDVDNRKKASHRSI